MMESSAQPKIQEPPEIDLEDARYFLDLLESSNNDFTFQTLDDRRKQPDPTLTKIYHGSLDKHAEALQYLNSRGAGIFVMINEGDGLKHEGKHSCRTAANVIRIRSLFIDLDGSPLEPVQEATPSPHIVVNSSPGKWHAYWRVSDCPLDEFSSLQKRLIKRFNSDPSVHDLPRVMRVPGFIHQKTDPFRTTVIFPERTK